MGSKDEIGLSQFYASGSNSFSSPVAIISTMFIELSHVRHCVELQML